MRHYVEHSQHHRSQGATTVYCYLISSLAAVRKDKEVRRLLEQRKQSNTLLSSTTAGSSAGSTCLFWRKYGNSCREHFIDLRLPMMWALVRALKQGEVVVLELVNEVLTSQP
jgi:hypothetical protein